MKSVGAGRRERESPWEKTWSPPLNCLPAPVAWRWAWSRRASKPWPMWKLTRPAVRHCGTIDPIGMSSVRISTVWISRPMKTRWTSSPGAFPARPFPTPERSWALRTPGAPSFMSLPGVSRRSSPKYLWRRTSGGLLPTTMAVPSPPSSTCWRRWATARRKECSMPPTSAWGRSGSAW